MYAAEGGNLEIVKYLHSLGSKVLDDKGRQILGTTLDYKDKVR